MLKQAFSQKALVFLAKLCYNKEKMIFYRKRSEIMSADPSVCRSISRVLFALVIAEARLHE